VVKSKARASKIHGEKKVYKSGCFLDHRAVRKEREGRSGENEGSINT